MPHLSGNSVGNTARLLRLRRELPLPRHIRVRLGLPRLCRLHIHRRRCFCLRGATQASAQPLHPRTSVSSRWHGARAAQGLRAGTRASDALDSARSRACSASTASCRCRAASACAWASLALAASLSAAAVAFAWRPQAAALCQRRQSDTRVRRAACRGRRACVPLQPWPRRPGVPPPPQLPAAAPALRPRAPAPPAPWPPPCPQLMRSPIWRAARAVSREGCAAGAAAHWRRQLVCRQRGRIRGPRACSALASAASRASSASAASCFCRAAPA